VWGSRANGALSGGCGMGWNWVWEMVLSYTRCKKGKKLSILSAYRVCKQTHPGDLNASKQQLRIIYEDKELHHYLLDPKNGRAKTERT
jgi:hypothetical protein